MGAKLKEAVDLGCSLLGSASKLFMGLDSSFDFLHIPLSHSSPESPLNWGRGNRGGGFYL